jgi:hypothetical protein
MLKKLDSYSPELGFIYIHRVHRSRDMGDGSPDREKPQSQDMEGAPETGPTKRKKEREKERKQKDGDKGRWPTLSRTSQLHLGKTLEGTFEDAE